MFLDTFISFQTRTGKLRMIFQDTLTLSHGDSWPCSIKHRRTLLHLSSPTQVCWEASVNLELEATWPYYFGATKDQCRISPGLTVPWATRQDVCAARLMTYTKSPLNDVIEEPTSKLVGIPGVAVRSSHLKSLTKLH